jgi:hypothetical protein
VLVLGACGEPADPARDALGAHVPVLGADAVTARYGVPVMPPSGVAFAQEIWISHTLPRGDGRPGWRLPRTRDEALAIARGLYAKVEGGANIGSLARTASNAPGGRADGFAPLPVLHDPSDARARVFLGTPVGALTPLIEYNGGFWFARRIDDTSGRVLEEKFQMECRRRARARVIVFLHKDAYLKREEVLGKTRETALAEAQTMFRMLEEGRSFESLAREFSNDTDSRARGGLLHASEPREGESPDWLRWGDRWLPADLLDVILYTGEVGKVHPRALDTSHGIVLVEILEREP